jgi:hypothetical protein
MPVIPAVIFSPGNNGPTPDGVPTEKACKIRRAREKKRGREGFTSKNKVSRL